ncbi:cation:proton antiporter [Candidatus Micrarchaeota archaeon]|nr:cation:proton antiporter [Candidatus Micrarchaeota archaeon]
MADGLLGLLVALSLAFFFGEAAHRVGIARVIGQLLAGVLLALPAARAVLSLDGAGLGLSLLATVGSVLLFFFVGLEIDLREFQKNLKPAFSVAVLNTAIPLIAGFILMKALGYADAAALLVGMALAVSSVSASIDFLEELGLLRSKIGKFIVASGTVDDVLELILTGAVLALLHADLRQDGTPGLLTGIAVFLVLVAAFRAWLVPWALSFFEASQNKTAMLTGALILTLLMAFLGEYLGMGALIGAFLAGVLIRHQLDVKARRPWEEHQLTHNIHTLAFGFFVPLLFVSIGYQVDTGLALQNLPLGMMLTAVAIVGTVIGAALGVRVSGGTWKHGVIVGFGVSSKGDVELVIASLALSAGIIAAPLFNALVFMSLATTLVSPVAFRMLVRHHHGKDVKDKNMRKKA